MIVPGDRVVIALDSSITHAVPILQVLGQTLRDAGVEPDGIYGACAHGGNCRHGRRATYQGASIVVHDARDRSQLAYLAATKEGRRIYLNRLLTDADVVIPVGRMGYDPILGHRGPWSVLFPDLSERETIEVYRGAAAERARGAGRCAGSRPSRRVIRGELAARMSISGGGRSGLCRTFGVCCRQGNCGSRAGNRRA